MRKNKQIKHLKQPEDKKEKPLKLNVTFEEAMKKIVKVKISKKKTKSNTG